MKLLAFLIAISTSTVSANSAKPVISFKRQAFIPEQHLVLSDLIYIKNAASLNIDKINATDISYHANAKVITKSDIIRLVNSEQELGWRGKEQIPVITDRDTNVISQEIIQQKALDCLKSHLSEIGYSFHYSIQISKTITPINLNEHYQYLDCTINNINQKSSIPAFVSVTVNAMDDNKTVLSARSTVIQFKTTVPTLISDVVISPNSTLDKKQFKVKDITYDGYPARIFELESLVSNEQYLIVNMLDEGQALHKSDTIAKPLIQKGSLAKLIASDSTVEVSFNVEALDHGYIKDVIEIKIPSTNKTLKAEVIDKGILKPYEN